MTPTLFRLLDAQANTLSTGTTAHLQAAIRTQALPEVFAHTEFWRSGNYPGDLKDSNRLINDKKNRQKEDDGKLGF